VAPILQDLVLRQSGLECRSALYGVKLSVLGLSTVHTHAAGRQRGRQKQ